MEMRRIERHMLESRKNDLAERMAEVEQQLGAFILRRNLISESRSHLLPDFDALIEVYKKLNTQGYINAATEYNSIAKRLGETKLPVMPDLDKLPVLPLKIARINPLSEVIMQELREKYPSLTDEELEKTPDYDLMYDRWLNGDME